MGVDVIISIMRHGKVDGPAGLYGHTDIACSNEGQEDMAKQIALLPGITEVISSPRIRCLEFAQVLCKRHRVPLKVNPEFAELSFGDWDGKTFDEMQDYWHDVEDYFRNPGTTTPPGGEPLSDFYERITLAWQKMLVSIKSESPLLICHGAVIRMIIANVLQCDLNAGSSFWGAWFSNLDIRHASVTQIQMTQHQGQSYFRLLQIGSKLSTHSTRISN